MLPFNREDDIEWNSYPMYVVFNTLAPVSELPFFENTAQNQNQFKIKEFYGFSYLCSKIRLWHWTAIWISKTALTSRLVRWSHSWWGRLFSPWNRAYRITKNRVNFVKFWILNPNLGFILPAELSAIALTVSMRSGIVWHRFLGSRTSSCLTTDRNGACSGFDDGE